MPDKISKLVGSVNSAWGIFVIVAFFTIFGYSLSLNVVANGQKIDKAITIMGKQTEIMLGLTESLNDKDRDHVEFTKGQTETIQTQREIVRLMDKMVVLIGRKL